MKAAKVTVSWKEGLHLRTAAKVASLARSFRSKVVLKVNRRIADARSVPGLLLLCAALGTIVEIEAVGEDEDAALAGIAAVFNSSD